MTRAGFLCGCAVAWMAACVPVTEALAEVPSQLQTVSVEYGAHVYGNMASLVYRRQVFGHFDVGVGLGRGQVAVVHKKDRKVFGVVFNRTGNDLHELIDVRMLGTLFVSYVWGRNRSLVWLSPIELGLSHAVGSLEMRFRDEGYPGVFEGVKHLSAWGPYLSCTLVELRPASTPRMRYALGGKLYLGLFRTAFVMTTVNSRGDVWKIYSGELGSTGWGVIPYPELFLRIAYGF